MQYLDLTLPTAAENVALDEALLDDAEANDSAEETLRIWEPAAPMVVIGRSSSAEVEVKLDYCREHDIPVLRRVSGGAAIVAGPGCLMYALVLDYRRRPELRSINAAHRWVLNTIGRAIGKQVPGIKCQGTSDLAIGPQKFSGNSARCRRNHLLYHGTLLYGFPLPLVEQCLAMPPRMPDYRAKRSHLGFVTNLPLDASVIRRALQDAFDAREPRPAWPQKRTERLVAEKYGREEWNDAGCM
jgi:lipoate---protein ligase